MQCNHSFCAPNFSTYGQCYHCNTVNSCKGSRPEVVGEGDVATLMLPDGSTQMYFIPASPSNKCCQPAPCNPVFGNWPQSPFQSQPIWFIRSISNPVPYTFQTQQSPPCGFPCPARPSYDCRGNAALPSPSPTQLQFHNDTCTSTSDLQYFFPQRSCLKVSNNCGACIQVSAPNDVGTCCSNVVIPDQNVSTNVDVPTSNKLIDCDCSQSYSKNNKSKKRKKNRSSSCSSSDRKSRKKEKKKKSKTVSECSMGAGSADMSIELSCESFSSGTRSKSCSSCTSCQSVFKNTGKKEKKIKKKKLSKTKKSASSSQDSCSCSFDVTATTSQTSSRTSDVTHTPSQTSTSSKKELKLKKQKEKKPKKQKEKKPKKEKQNKSSSGKSSTNSSLSTSSCCSILSKESTSSKDEKKKKKNEKKEKKPKIKKEKKVKEHKSNKEKKLKESSSCCSILSKESTSSKDEKKKKKKEKKAKEPKNKKEKKVKEHKANKEKKLKESKIKKEKKEKQEKKRKVKNEKMKKSKKEEILTETTNFHQRTIEESEDLCDCCARTCSSHIATSKAPDSLQGSCTCCSSHSFLKKDFCCMTSIEKCFDMNCIFQGGPSSDSTSYLIEQDNPETASCKVVMWYPLEYENQMSLAANDHSSLT